MPAGKLNLIIEQGSTFEKILFWKDIDGNFMDLTGYEACMQIRSQIGSTSVLLELTDGNGRIVLGGNTGQVTLVLTAAETTNLNWTDGVYEIKLTSPGGNTKRLLEGTIKVSKSVTKC